MASTDEVPYFQVLSEGYKTASQSKKELEDWLTKAAEESPETTLKNNESQSVPGKNSVYEDPGERVGDGHDAVWGEPPKQEPFHHSDPAYDESVNVRRGVLERQFSAFRSAEGSEREILAKNFAHVASGDFESHSALLQPKTKTAAESLLEQVRKVTREE